MNDLADHVVMGEDDAPMPVRYWWMKRIALVSVVMIVGLVVLRLWWGYEAQRRLDGAIEKYRAAGQMVEAYEFDAVLDAVPDEENAALLYEQAILKLVVTSASGINFSEFNDDRSLFDTKPADAEELMSLNAEVMSLLREARSRKQIAWSDRLNVNPLNVNVTIYSQQRSLAKFLWFGVRYRMQRGEYAQAIETLRDLWLFSDAVIDHPNIFTFLTGTACQNLAVDSLEEVMGLLAKSDMPIDVEVRDQIRQFLHAAQDEAKHIAAVENSFLGARVEALQMISILSPTLLNAVPGQLSLGEKTFEIFVRPVVVLDTIRVLDIYMWAARAVHAATWRGALSSVRSDHVDTNLMTLLSRPFMGGAWYSVSESIERMKQIFFSHLAWRRMAVTGLALKLYEIEQGRWPGSLDELVPDYLSHVPRDPFGEMDDRLKYVVADDRVFIYSIEVDEVDDGGVKWDGKNQKGDRPFYLVGKPEE